MDDSHIPDTLQDNTSPQQDNETQRLHRLVIPMILDILRSRGEQRATRGNSSAGQSSDSLWNNLHGSRDEPPPLEDIDPSSNSASDESMVVDEADEANRSANSVEATHNSDRESAPPPPTTDQQGQTIPSPGTAPAVISSSSRRPRYRLVVYFEERDLSGGSEARENEEGGGGGGTQLRDNHRPSRYVAVFSIDSDAQNMPIIHSAGVQQSPANFDDLLNQLFTSYMPKGTPPAKKEIIDSLPTTTYSHETCSTQPRCTVCLEEFTEGTEVVVLPCTHQFHGEECVKPWLRMHNSCPLCRYEMPVDDMEYEERRKERMATRTLSTTPAAENDAHGLC